jgi:hypothetical protein
MKQVPTGDRKMFSNYLRLISFIVIVVSFVLTGCSAGDRTPPLPGEPFADNYESIGPTAVGVSDYDTTGNPSGGVGTLGLFSVHVNPTDLTGEMSSLRKGSLTDVLETVDITNFMTLSPCSDCAKLHSISINTDGNIVLSIGVRHPFPAGDFLKPVSGKNRGDLHVFNVEGYVISDGVSTGNYPGIGETTGGYKLVNADGYSAYQDQAWDEFYPTESTIHPYIMHFDDYSQGNFDASNPMGFESVTTPPPSGNLVMPMGSSEDIKDYIFNIPADSSIDFIFAIGCTYAVSASNKIDRFNPEYRIPQHNKKAASEVWVEITGEPLTAGDTNSSTTMNVCVVDISHGVPVGDALDQMKSDSSVSGILVEVPGVTLSPVSFNTTPVSGSGHEPSDPLVFSGEIVNAAGADTGIYTGLVKVTDSYQPGLNESSLLNGMDAIKRVDPVSNPLMGLFTIDEFATYQTFPVEVIYVCVVPTDVDYNLTLSTVRSSTSEVIALRLDWDSQPDATDYHIYKKDAFDPSAVFELVDDAVSTDNFYEDTDFIGYEGYKYYIRGIFCDQEANASNEVFVLLENAEGDNVNTNSVWETMDGTNGLLTFNTMRWDICHNLPANGSGQWNPRGYDHIFHNHPCIEWWTGSFTMLCSPVIPVPENSSTAYIEFNVQVKILPPSDPQCGTNVGVADAVSNSAYWPSLDLRSGWAYNCDNIVGFNMDWGTGTINYPNIDDTNNSGYAYIVGDEYNFAAYNLPDLLTKANARAVIAWAASNYSVLDVYSNYDDIAVIVY